MRYTRVGRAGLTVSRLALGTMNFGTYVPEDDAFALLDRAIEAGVTVLDTADVYGWGDNAGRSEEVVGRYLAARSGRRDDVVVATKVYRPMGSGANSRGLSALHVRRACEASLRRLNVDHLDLYQFHHFDRSTPVDETWEACELLRQQGKIVYFGSSNFAAWQLFETQTCAHDRHMTGLVSEQSVFNLMTRHVELEVMPACARLGLGFFAWSPLSDGLLAGPGNGAGRRTEPKNVAARERYDLELRRYYEYCSTVGLSPAQVAVAWVLHQPGVTSAILGPRTVEQLDNLLGSADISLDQTVLDELDRLFPGFRQAPEHYAW